MTIVADSWLDKNALNDTLKVKKKVLMICDTNNFSRRAHEIIIGNNKSGKSLGNYILSFSKRLLQKQRTLKADIPEIDWWTGERDEKPAYGI